MQAEPVVAVKVLQFKEIKRFVIKIPSSEGIFVAVGIGCYQKVSFDLYMTIPLKKLLHASEFFIESKLLSELDPALSP
jgi:hypothetical protein